MSTENTEKVEANLTVPPAPDTWTVGPVTRTDFVQYQGASGDMNPIHHDEEFARAAGFPTPFAVGMFQAGVVGSYATDWLGAANIRNYRIRFQAQVWPGDTLTIGGEVERTYRTAEGEPRVDVALYCDRAGADGGDPARAVSIWATFVLPEEQA